MPNFRRRLASAVLTAGAIIVAATAAVLISPGGGGIALADEPLGAGGEFHALTPERILDTRDRDLDVVPYGAKPTGKSASLTFDVPVVGVGGLEADPDEVLAIVASVTVVAPQGRGHLQIFPKGSDPGDTSVINFDPGQTVPNSAILRPGDGGMVTMRLYTEQPGTAHVLLDMSGWFSTSAYPTRGARVKVVEPTRIYDTKGLTGTPNVQSIQIHGAKELGGTKTVVPDDPDVVGVVVNFTGVNSFPGSRPTHMALVPNAISKSNPDSWPTTSNLNLVPGQTRANLAILPVGSDGKIRLFNLQGEVRAVVDVVAYLETGASASSTAGRVIPLVAPFRSLDTRKPAFHDQPLHGANAEVWSFDAFVHDVEVNGSWIGPQSGLFGNMTAVGLQRQYSWAPVNSHMTAYPAQAGSGSAEECKSVPDVSNLNMGEGEVVPNMALLKYGGTDSKPNRLCVFNLAGSIDYLLDVYAVILE